MLRRGFREIRKTREVSFDELKKENLERIFRNIEGWIDNNNQEQVIFWLLSLFAFNEDEVHCVGFIKPTEENILGCPIAVKAMDYLKPFGYTFKIWILDDDLRFLYVVDSDGNKICSLGDKERKEIDFQN